MSKSELHDWECDIEELSGNNASKMLDIAQDIYNTAFVRGRNSMTWEQTRWIPTSEKLPQPNEYEGNVCKYYLVQDDTGDMYVANYTRKGWHPIDTLFFLNEVVAWMPLPEPYKTEMESEE